MFFGLDPIDPGEVRPPAAPSGVLPERGLVMLRAEEGPACWESAAPAAGMRLAANYAHNVNDAFALAGFYAFNRPIYMNRQSCRTYAQGYSRSIQSHCGLVVDGQEPRFTAETTIRKGFDPRVKFAAARSSKVYEDVDLTRALFLTREYLLDVSSLASPRQRRYHWLVHAIGPPPKNPPGDWRSAGRIDGLLPDSKGVRRLSPGEKDWSVTVVQDCPMADAKKTALGEGWYRRRIGVQMTMLGQKGTTAWLAETPRFEREPRRPDPGPDEIGGTTIAASRNSKATVFVALHEPLKGARSRIARFRRIAQDHRGLAVAIVGRSGSGIDDRLMLALGDGVEGPVTLAGESESFTFLDYAYIRIGRDAVEISGRPRAFSIRVAGRPRLLVNGKPQEAMIAGGVMTFEAK